MKLHNEELRNLYSSPKIIKVVMSRMMRWAGQNHKREEEKYI
jgi:hypothetical protein